jgi:hypothetical protein
MFFYSLPLFFEHINFFSSVELTIFASSLIVILFIHAYFTTKNKATLTNNNYLYACWLGNMDLKWAFWPFFLVLNITIYTADTLVKTGVFTVSMWDDIHFVFFLFSIWWFIAIWRCANNTDYLLFTVLARFLALSVFFEYFLKVVIRFNYARLFLECEELLLDYGSCF